MLLDTLGLLGRSWTFLNILCVFIAVSTAVAVPAIVAVSAGVAVSTVVAVSTIVAVSAIVVSAAAAFGRRCCRLHLSLSSHIVANVFPALKLVEPKLQKSTKASK